MKCVDLMSVCCEGKSDLAELKCQLEILTIESAYKIIETCEYFWILKLTIVNYITECFLDSSNTQVLSSEDSVGI